MKEKSLIRENEAIHENSPNKGKTRKITLTERGAIKKQGEVEDIDH